MSFQFIANLIIVLCVLGILVIFLRRIPEVVEENGQLQFGGSAGSSEPSESAVYSFFVGIINKIWHFMLEAKDLKQGQILASKFASFVKPKARVINIGAYNSIGKAARLFQEGKDEESEQTYIQVIRKHPHEYSAYEGLIKIYFKQKKYDDIIEILEYLVSHNPQNDSYLAQLGNANLSLRKYDEAVRAYEKALALNSSIPARFVNLGLSLQGAGRLGQAIESFQKAVDLDPANMQYLVIFADALLKKGDKDAAIEMLSAANNRYPENLEIQQKLVEIQQ
ncbi:MAG: Tetratricopeptide 2 repeat-containing protein [Candidatus Doudnabacteria bacterium]|nr:Tetratricopeptide 2 repeat-containing protein [Candidatus Doudnabacteria bacterium]